jgi:hypothetical protein
MPYIKEIDRNKFDYLIKQLEERIESKGDLNYIISELTARLILKTGISYTSISNWIDGVHGAERELTRQLLHPYEDQKIMENGQLKSFAKILADLTI